MATRVHRCDLGASICLARSSHRDGFVALPPAAHHRDARPRKAAPKHGIDDVFAPCGTCLLSYQTALSAPRSYSAPFNAHSCDGVGAA